MSNRKNQLKLTKLRHSSLDLADAEIKKKHYDVLARARNKLLMISDALKHRKPEENNNERPLAKSMTQCTLDYLFKHTQQDKDVKEDGCNSNGTKIPLQKQSSLGSYPIEIRISSYDSDIEDPEFSTISRLRPATVCVDRPSVDRRRDAEALALERPRKKLSFKVPVVECKKEKSDRQRNGHVATSNHHNYHRPSAILNHNENGKQHQPKSEINDTLNRKFTEQISKLKNNVTHMTGKHHSGKCDPEFSLGKGIQSMAGIGLSVVTNGVNQTSSSSENIDSESQALRIVRTVGQAFEVCHKLSIGAPEENLDDEQDTTITQDLLSDRLSDIVSDKNKKDGLLETGNNSDKFSLGPDEISFNDSYMENSIKNKSPTKSPSRLEVLAPPPINNNSNNNGKQISMQSETYASPLSDGFNSSSGGGGGGTTQIAGNNPLPALPPPGSALSSHHELQLLRQQLEQQKQQTQAAVAQLQLAREQLQAEQTARVEAQARTHQLLVHNRELLDHIAALVSHLQNGDKPGQQSSPPHMTMPQHPPDNHQDQQPQMDPNLLLQSLGFGSSGILENRAVTTCQSPLRTQFSPSGSSIFNYNYPPIDPSFENQLLQRLQPLGAFSTLQPQYQLNLSQTLPLLAQGLYNQALLNNNFCIPNTSHTNISSNPYATLPRYSGNLENKFNTASRQSEPRQLPQSYNQDLGQKTNIQDQYGQQYNQQNFQQQIPNYSRTYQLSSGGGGGGGGDSLRNLSADNQQTKSNTLLTPDIRQQRERSPNPSITTEPQIDDYYMQSHGTTGTLTRNDNEGRVRVMVPQTSSSSNSRRNEHNNDDDEARNMLSNLRIDNDMRSISGPGISRSASERVPNRSELMSQVQRTTWARHTTK